MPSPSTTLPPLAVSSGHHIQAPSSPLPEPAAPMAPPHQVSNSVPAAGLPPGQLSNAPASPDLEGSSLARQLEKLGNFGKSVAKLVGALVCAPILGGLFGVVTVAQLIAHPTCIVFAAFPPICLTLVGVGGVVGAAWRTGKVLLTFVGELTRPYPTFDGAVNRSWSCATSTVKLLSPVGPSADGVHHTSNHSLRV